MERSHERKLLLQRLRPRDLEVVTALIRYPHLAEPDVASLMNIGLHNLRARAKHAYAVLGLEGRLHLYAAFHTEVLKECGCI